MEQKYSPTQGGQTHSRAACLRRCRRPSMPPRVTPSSYESVYMVSSLFWPKCEEWSLTCIRYRTLVSFWVKLQNWIFKDHTFLIRMGSPGWLQAISNPGSSHETKLFLLGGQLHGLSPQSSHTNTREQGFQLSFFECISETKLLMSQYIQLQWSTIELKALFSFTINRKMCLNKDAEI